MADVALSSKSTTAVITGGYVYIIIPDVGSPTGYSGYRITVANLLADLQALVTANTASIATNIANITALQNLGDREQWTDEVGASFQFAQPANSIITKFRFRSTGSATCTITGSVTGTIKSGITLTDGVLYDHEHTVDSVAGQTITFTITGTVSAEVYYDKSTI